MKTINAKRSIFATVIGLSLGLAGCGGDAETKTDFNAVDIEEPVSDWQMVWSDEFDGDQIDPDKWFHEVDCNGGGNQEQQCYTDSPENSYVEDGVLNIVALPADNDAPLPYTSARLSTKNLADFKYGRFEMRAKMPFGQGTWPAFWMLPTDEVYGGWPKSGEIDIVEAVNLKTIDDNGVTEATVHGTLHYGRDWPNNVSSGKSYHLPDNLNPADDFHTYAIEWQEGEIRWYVDGYLFATQMASEVRYNSKGQAAGLKHRGWFTEYYDIISGDLTTHWDAAPYNEYFHLLLNLAVGGSWAGNVNDTGIDAAAFAGGQKLQVDYVRVYECSVNPANGKGCETVRAGYKDKEADGVVSTASDPTGALVSGEAPIPKPPSTGIAVNLTIFSESENSSWPIWGDEGEIAPIIVEDSEEYGNVVEFAIGESNTVMGFNVFESDNPLGFDASPMVENGKVSFDMKVVTPPSDSSATWTFKIESNAREQDVTLNLSESNEGVAPVVGEWQTYTFDLSVLDAAELDLTNIDVLMIFPTWGAGNGAVYRVDNVKISQEGGAANNVPELVLFEETENPIWELWDCCAGSIPEVVADDDEHGNVVEFAIGEQNETVLGFKPEDDSDVSFDASALINDGVVEFDLKVVSPPNDPNSVWKFKIESVAPEGDVRGAVELDLVSVGNAPVQGEWSTYTFTLQSLQEQGLDISAIDVIMIFPAWQTGTGAVYRLDNAKIYSPSAAEQSDDDSGENGDSGDNSAGTLFADGPAAGWAVWDCCTSTNPGESLTVDEDTQKLTAHFSIPADASDGTVMGFNSRTDAGGAGVSFDATALVGSGQIQFDMKVITPPNNSTSVWKFKVESNGGSEAEGSAIELNLTDSSEGIAPVTGQWQTYTYSLSELNNGPAWQTGNGAVYRIDNVKIVAP